MCYWITRFRFTLWRRNRWKPTNHIAPTSHPRVDHPIHNNKTAALMSLHLIYLRLNFWSFIFILFTLLFDFFYFLLFFTCTFYHSYLFSFYVYIYIYLYMSIYISAFFLSLYRRFTNVSFWWTTRFIVFSLSFAQHASRRFCLMIIEIKRVNDAVDARNE